MLGDEVVVHIVQEFGLLVGLGAFAPDVVEEHGEGADAQVVHLFEFGHERVAVLCSPFDVDARVDGPVEVHAPLFGVFVQFLYAFGFGIGVSLSPVVAVVGVVLGTVDIDVHFVASVELNLAQACLVAPRSAVETLHGSPECHVGPVGDGAAFHFSFSDGAEEGLHAIEQSGFVGTCNHGTLGCDFEEVALSVCRYACGIFLHRLVALHAECEGEGRLAVGGNAALLQCFDGKAVEACGISFDDPGFRCVQQVAVL